MTQTIHRIQTAFEQLTLDTVPDLMALYAQDASFKDPFNNVCGKPAIERIYRHMFKQVQAPKFKVNQVFEAGTQVCMLWVFSFDTAKGSVHIPGATHFGLDAQGCIATHLDYWDPAQGLYESVPLLGWVLRLIKRKLATHQPD